jgi:hypothetical protein
MQKGFSSLTEDELKAANVDMQALSDEAKQKVKDLDIAMKLFENKIKGL